MDKSTQLTQNQELYCQARMRGLTQRLAYLEAYPKSRSWSKKAVDEAACHLESNSKVSARLKQLNVLAEGRATISRSRILNRLDRLADASAGVVETQLSLTGGMRLDADAGRVLVSATHELLPYAQDDAPDDGPFVADFAMLISRDFFEPHRLIARGASGDLWFTGGRGSTKSSFCSLEVVNWVERHPDEHAVVLMRYKAALRDAAYAQVVWAINALGLADGYDMPDSTLRIRKKSTGQLVLFRGCDDASKIKSIKVPFGHVGIAWFEEADMFRGMAEIRKVNQSLSRGGNHCVRLYSFNPPRSRWCWINREMDRLREEGGRVWSSSYLNVPREWLGDQFFEDADELRRVDPVAARHEYDGEPVGDGTEVFDRVEFREITDEEISAFDNPKAGQDFGWYPDPWAFVLSEWRQDGRQLLTWREDGGQKLQPPEQAERVRRALTWATPGDERPRYHALVVQSDDASPQVISAQRDSGVDARASGKGDMRDASYMFLQSAHWVIDPRRCPRLAEEVRSMQYEVNQDGEVLSAIPDGNDHWVDAARYSVMPLVRRARSAYRGATPSGR